MREYTSTFDGFDKGLRPTEDVAKNTETLIYARNLKATVGGMVSVIEPELIPGVTTTWPLPQLFKTQAGLIIASHIALDMLNPDDTITPLIGGIAPGDWWDMADYMDYVVATNGTRMVVFNPTLNIWQVYVGAEFPIVGTLCDFNGQLIMGDLPTTWSAGTDENWVAWSRIGSVDARLDDAGNVAGMTPMRWKGPVLKVMKLGQHVMVYGAMGIAPLMPTQTAGGWGIPKRNMFDFGIATRRCVTGDDSEHYFLDTSGHLWRITDNHAITSFGYREFFAPMLGTDIVMSFDPIRREVRICNHETGYILTPQGLGGPLDVVISDTVYDDSRRGLVVGIPQEYTYNEASVIIEPQDEGIREFKNTGWINVTQKWKSTTEVGVDFKSNHEVDAYGSTPWTETNPENAGFIRQAGTDVRIKARFTDFDPLTERVLVSKLAYAIQGPDRRFTRGARGGRGEKV